MQIINTLIIAIIVSLVAAFALLNRQAIEVNYYIGTMELPLSITLIVGISSGFLLGILLTFTSFIKAKLAVRYFKKQLKHQDDELSKLRLQNLDQEQH